MALDIWGLINSIVSEVTVKLFQNKDAIKKE